MFKIYVKDSELDHAEVVLLKSLSFVIVRISVHCPTMSSSLPRGRGSTLVANGACNQRIFPQIVGEATSRGACRKRGIGSANDCGKLRP